MKDGESVLEIKGALAAHPLDASEAHHLGAASANAGEALHLLVVHHILEIAAEAQLPTRLEDRTKHEHRAAEAGAQRRGLAAEIQERKDGVRARDGEMIVAGERMTGSVGNLDVRGLDSGMREGEIHPLRRTRWKKITTHPPLYRGPERHRLRRFVFPNPGIDRQSLYL